MGRIEMILLTQRDILAMNIGIGQVISLVEAGIGEHGRGRVENPPEPGLHATPNFLAEVSAPSPDAHEKTPLFYGWYSNHTWGYRKACGLIPPVRPDQPTGEAERAFLALRRSWARPIRQVYAGDPLGCPRCGGTRKILAVIERPAVLRQRLDPWGLPSLAPARRAPPDPTDALTAQHPREWSSAPVYDDLPLPAPLLV